VEVPEKFPLITYANYYLKNTPLALAFAKQPHFASWVLGTPHSFVKVLKTELSIEPIRVYLRSPSNYFKEIAYINYFVKLFIAIAT
jgi:hypothetical protein